MTNSASDLGTPVDETVKTEEKKAEDTAGETAEKPAEKPMEKTEESVKAEIPAPDSPISAPSAGTQSVDNNDVTLFDPNKMGILNDVNIALSIEIGRSEIKIRDLLNLTKGSIVELNKLSGEPVEVYANGKMIALGEIITVNGKYCVRLSACTDLQTGVKSNGK